MQGKYRYLAITLSLAEFVDEKEETNALERVAFLLRLSIYRLVIKINGFKKCRETQLSLKEAQIIYGYPIDKCMLNCISMEQVMKIYHAVQGL